MATFSNTTNATLITGTSAADSVKTTLDGATVSALGGNNSIRNYGVAVTLTVGTDASILTLTDTSAGVFY